MIDAFSLNFANPVTDYLKRTQAQIAASSPQTAPDGHVLTDAEIADRARAQGAGAGAASSLGAATTTGQQTESAQAGAMASSSAAAALPASAPERAPDGHILTDAEIADRARARGAGASAAASSAAASTAGQQQESTQAGQMASASAEAAKPASVPTPPAPPPPPADPFHSVSGDNVKAYLDKKSATLGQDPGAISEAGQLYADRVTNGLKTPDASSVNAQNTQDTAASRRAYLARVQADEAIGQSGFSVGTSQADRIRTNSQAGVDEANQAGQNSVNAYVRQRTEDNMNRAKDLETQQYGRNLDTLQQVQGQDLQEYGRSEKATDRGLQAAATAYAHGRDTVGDQHWDTTNTQQQTQQGVENSHWDTTNTQQQTQQGVDNAHWSTMNQQQQTQLGFENAQVIKGSDDSAKRNLLASLPDGPAKNKVMAGLQDGSLTLQNALDSVFGSDGSVKPEYQGKTPGQLGLAAETEYAQQTVDLQYPNLKNTNPQDYLAKVNQAILDKRKVTDSPINTQVDQQSLTDASKRLAAGGTDQKDLALLPPTSPQSIPHGDAVQDWLAKNNTGGWSNIGGTPYRIMSGGSNLSGDYTVLKDQSGKTVYMGPDGTIHNNIAKMPLGQSILV
jgi:hypothetical protein